MKIALLGYGKMGRLIEELAVAQGHQIVCRAGRDFIHWEEILCADVCIDFSHAEGVIEHLRQCGLRGKNLVIGTTGWEAHLEEARSLAADHGIGVLYAPNFSLGVHLFLKMVSYAAALMNPFAEYAVAGIEWHHAAKRDAPSGTALEMARCLKKSIDRIDEVNLTSVRLGSIPGTHVVIFDSFCDTISISHEARNREGFAKGAVSAARWLIGKQGYYTLEDFIHAS
jgi:4-hydroxy-tetrahydrodipicolinate reductase